MSALASNIQMGEGVYMGRGVQKETKGLSTAVHTISQYQAISTGIEVGFTIMYTENEASVCVCVGACMSV